MPVVGSIITGLITRIWEHLGTILSVLLLSHFARNYFKPGVSEVPGPFLAKISNIWRFIDVAGGRAQETHLKLHERYGQYVRLGPKIVSVQNREVLKTIYGIKKGYYKSSFYEVQQQLVNGKPTQTFLFTTLDEDFHARIKRPVSSAYSMSALTELEIFVDKTIQTMITKLDEFATKGDPLDLATWLQYYAFDVIGELTFGKPLGFLEQGKDISGIIYSLEKTLDYAGMIGQMPWLDHLLIKNPIKRMFGGRSTGAIAKFARQCLEERLQRQEEIVNKHMRGDFLTRFLMAKETHPRVVNNQQVFSYTLSNINAGSDTTAISLRAVIYLLLKHPEKMGKLMNELVAAHSQGRMSVPVTWKESQELPYLDAVIKEALRLHPAVGRAAGGPVLGVCPIISSVLRSCAVLRLPPSPK